MTFLQPFRIFIDTSVIGGYFDEKFAADSRRIFDLAFAGQLLLVINDIVLAELAPAPEQVRTLLDRLPKSTLNVLPVDKEVATLRDAYLESGVLSERWSDDAAHVATATVTRADALISWNFKHMVRLDRIQGIQSS